MLCSASPAAALALTVLSRESGQSYGQKGDQCVITASWELLMEPRVPKAALKYSHRKGLCAGIAPGNGTAQPRAAMEMGCRGISPTQEERSQPTEERAGQEKLWDVLGLSREGGRRTAARAAGGEQLSKELTDGKGSSISSCQLPALMGC